MLTYNEAYKTCSGLVSLFQIIEKMRHKTCIKMRNFYYKKRKFKFIDILTLKKYFSNILKVPNYVTKKSLKSSKNFEFGGQCQIPTAQYD